MSLAALVVMNLDIVVTSFVPGRACGQQAVVASCTRGYRSNSHPHKPFIEIETTFLPDGLPAALATGRLHGSQRRIAL